MVQYFYFVLNCLTHGTRRTRMLVKWNCRHFERRQGCGSCVSLSTKTSCLVSSRNPWNFFTLFFRSQCFLTRAYWGMDLWSDDFCWEFLILYWRNKFEVNNRIDIICSSLCRPSLFFILSPQTRRNKQKSEICFCCCAKKPYGRSTVASKLFHILAFRCGRSSIIKANKNCESNDFSGCVSAFEG